MDYNLILSYTFIILSIVFLEGLLSVDNAVVISMIANKAKPEDRPKVIKYGIIGAFVFRGLALFAVSWLLSNPQIGGYAKVLGALYLIKMGWEIISHTSDPSDGDEVPGWMEKLFKGLGVAGLFVIILEVEFADFVFSIDNLFAAVAFTANIKGEIWGYPLNIVLTIVGVFLGIITMRWVTVKVMKLIEKYPSLNTSAGIVILLLGIKLLLSGIFTLVEHYKESMHSVHEALHPVMLIMESHTTDFVFSMTMMCIFIYPIVSAKFSKKQTMS
jgi:YkoY family integral membrane protein